MAKPLSRRILRELKHHQLDVVSHRSKRHHVITVRAPSGGTGIIVVSCTPSDRRTRRHDSAMIKRTAHSLT